MTFSVLYLWKSNYLNEITGDHANENYEVNIWGKYCRIYPEFAHTKKTTMKTGFLRIFVLTFIVIKGRFIPFHHSLSSVVVPAKLHHTSVNA
jgi:hypothetical protein